MKSLTICQRGEICFPVGEYADILSIAAGLSRGSRAVQSFIDDNGHYHYIDIDRLEADGDQSGDQGEGLEESNEATVRQPPSPRDYVRLAAGDNAVSTQQTTEQIEMNVLDRGHDYQNAVG